MKHPLTAVFGTVLALCGLVVSISALAAAEHTKDTLATVKQNIAAGKAILVDVREQSEWDDGHLQSARLLPLSEIPERVTGKLLDKQLPRGTVLYLHCAAGRRCLQAADLLQKQGYEVRPLRDGYETLLKNGFPKAEK